MTTVREDPDFSSGASLIPPEKPFRWRRRILSRWGVVYTVAGNGEIALGEARCTVGPGDLLLCAPEMEHCYTGFPGWRYLWFHLLPPDGIELPDGPEPVPGVVTLHFSEWRERRRVLRDLLEAHALELQRLSGWFELATALLRNVLLRAACCREPGGDGGRLRRALRLLSAAGEPCPIDEVARCCGMSRAVFYRFFRERTGCTPREYRERLALRHAQALLRDSAWFRRRNCCAARFFGPLLFFEPVPEILRTVADGVPARICGAQR